MKKHRASKQRRAKAAQRKKRARTPAAAPELRAARTAAKHADDAARVEMLRGRAWKLANRFGYILDVEPARVFEATRGDARVETVRHLTAHVLLEIDAARPTDLKPAMGRDRQTLRNSFKRAWDLREDGDVEKLILFVSASRRARFKHFKRAARPARKGFAAALTATGKGGRLQPQDFQDALNAAAHALVHGGAPEDPRATLARVTKGANVAPATLPTPAQRGAEMPDAATILACSPLTRRLLGEPSIEASPTAAGGARVEVSGRALKGDMGAISTQLTGVLEAAGFTATLDGVFGVPNSTRKRAVVRVAPAIGSAR